MNRWMLKCGLAMGLALPGTVPFSSGQELEPTVAPLIRIGEPSGWSTELRLQRDSREFAVGAEDVMDVQIDHLVFRLGARVLPFLQGWVEAGTVRAEQTARRGEAGFEWAVGGHVKVLEYVLSSSPVLGTTQGLSLEVNGSYRAASSEFPGAQLKWSDTRIIPAVAYTHNRLGEYRWHHAEPSGLVMRGGLVFNSTSGDFGDEDLEENRDFGAMASVDLRWESGWLTRLRGVFFGQDERELSISVGRHF